jgi:tetratricopeptide (TPR) repeat protein
VSSSPPTPIEDLDFDLPAIPAELPAARPAPPRGPPGKPPPPRAPQASATVETDLPVPISDLPAALGSPGNRRELQLSDLPMRAPDLPVPAAGLPVAAAGLPALTDPRTHLPAPAAALPVVLDSLPTNAGARAFGEIELPTVGDSFPPSTGPSPAAARNSTPASAPGGDLSFGLFGEIDLPHEAPPSSSQTVSARPSAPPPESADFGDLELDDRRKSVRPPTASAPPPGARSGTSKAAGGMSFGEVDIGVGSGAGADGVIGIEAFERADGGDAATAAQAAASAPARTSPQRTPAAALPAKRSIPKQVGGVALVLVLLGGGALQLTPYGAFGHLVISDALHAGDYQRATAAAIADADKATASDTYDDTRTMLDSVVAAHESVPRDRPLTAYAAFADYATALRFGPDTTRVSRASQLLATLPTDKPVAYADLALAAQQALDNRDKGVAALADASSRVPPSDPVELDVALLTGNLALTAKDGAAAKVAFTRALGLSNDARAHFGLARAADLSGDAAGMKQEVEATLAASPHHPGALTLRARPASAAADPVKALADLALILDGPLRSKASPNELSAAYAAKAWVSLERGGATDAREAFAQAVALAPRNVDALNGEGRLFLNEERFAEALARFDTALGIDPNSPETVANDAEAKIALERLADAKQQLLAAREQFPKSIPILILLGKVEQHLGNNDAAEADLRAAVALVVPSRGDAVLPYVALSKLLSERGRVADAKALLDDAKKKLTPSPALERAFGEISELQGDYDAALEHYRAAIAKDPKDAAAHFRLGVVLRRIRKFDDAGAELDRVAAVDRDYPGLSLERGLLFEESGEVEKAIEQFNGALAKAPNDPDLQLRVGSAYVAIGRPDEALPMLHKVLDKRPTSAEAHHYIGRALMLQGPQSQTDALRYLKQAVELDPNRAEFHVYLAWAANDATPAQLELARDEIDRALALDNVNPEAYWQRGVLERMEGAVEDAVKDEKHALALRPSRYEAYATLAECYEDKNEDTAALGEWTKAIAGDAEGPEVETVRHPYWRFRYGKLLMERGATAAALAQLMPAVTTTEKVSPKPGWLAPLEFLSAEGLRKTGKRADAVDHYRRFLEIAPVNSPDRLDAQQAIAALGGH